MKVRPQVGWNYERGCEEENAYTALNSSGVLTPRPGPIIDPQRAREEQAEIVAKVHDWQQKETWFKNNGRNRFRVDEFAVIASWEKAEMAIAGWQNHSKIDSFRARYLEWLAKAERERRARTSRGESGMTDHRWWQAWVAMAFGAGAALDGNKDLVADLHRSLVGHCCDREF